MHAKSLKKITDICPFGSLIAFSVSILSVILHLAFRCSPSFSLAFQSTAAAAVRAALGYLTAWIPFSVGESLIVCLPVIVAFLCKMGFRYLREYEKGLLRFLLFSLSVMASVYTLFVFTMAAGYHTPEIEKRLSLEKAEINTESLYQTACILRDEATACLNGITYTEQGDSVMPYAVSTMSDKLNDAIDALEKKLPYLSSFHGPIKPVAFSELMTYAHISGVYTYFTGESNLNIAFPDYTLPYTAAHEMSHQRGIAREDEANFSAFLICRESDDAYLRYSGYVGVLEYFLNALASADREVFTSFYRSLPEQIQGEIRNYNRFFEKYEKSVAAEISGAVNDTYLKSQGQSAGSQSYGLVVDLTVAFYQSELPSA